MKENILQRMERIGYDRKVADFNVKMKMPYDFKRRYAEIRAREFYEECARRGLNCHVSVGGLDSITLFLFLRSIHIHVQAVSASYLEDKSIQKVHRGLGVVRLQPLKREDGSFWTKQAVIQECGFPVISKEIAMKIETLQNPTEKNKTVRHAIITGETGEYGGHRENTRMRLSRRWLELFGGADEEGRALGYADPEIKVSAKCCYYLKERPCDLWAKSHNSVPYLGLMASEGGRRSKSLRMNGCNYFGESTIRSCPFAIFNRDDLLRLALEMDAWYKEHWEEFDGDGSRLDTIVPTVYGTIEADEDGTLRTTGAQRTGCSFCGFGITLEKRPHRFDRLRERNPKEWEYLMYHLCTDENGEDYGWGRVLDYIGVGWEDVPQAEQKAEQLHLFE